MAQTVKEYLEQWQFADKQAREARKKADSRKAMLRLFLEEKFHDINIDLQAMDDSSLKCEGSPIGFCFYNGDIDPAHDDCLICGEPEERK